MLEEEISQIFGLNLVEIAEYVAIIGIVLAVVSLGITAFFSKKQSKVSSANLVLELSEPWRKERFKNALVDMQKGNHDSARVEELLNHLEDIAILWQDGTLKEIHVKEFFGGTLKFVRDDKFIQDFMKLWVDLNPSYYFVNLRKLLDKIEEWKI